MNENFIMHHISCVLWTAMSAAALIGSRLTAQTTTWTSFEDRTGHAIASSPQGGVLMFGGASLSNPNSLLDDTNRLNSTNTTWTREATPTSPSARSGHAMAATRRNGQPIYVVFGGNTQSGQVFDTWVNEGGGWTPRGQSTSPPARMGHAMVKDFFGDQVYLFGGLSSGVPLNDLYTFDPASYSWTLSSPGGASAPPQRRNHCLAYDPVLNRVILFGGQGLAGTLSDTWAYDPTTNNWASLNPSTSPPPRGESAVAYLLGLGIVLFGGRNPALPVGQQVLGDTWVFQGGNWTLQNVAISPAARFGHAMSPDQSATNLVLLGGSGASGAPIPGTWLWNGTQWSEQLPAPAARNGAAMAYDSTRNRHVVFGGRTVVNGADLDETWEIDGVNWRQRNPNPKPSPRSDAAVAYDSARARTVLFGGTSQASGIPLTDTWEWTGSTWLHVLPTGSPPSASGGQMAFDSKRNKCWAMVGTDVWNYDGVGWSSTPSPAPRYNHSLASDVQRGRAILYGGLTQPVPTASFAPGDTWEWDQGTWYRKVPSQNPLPRERWGAAIAFDPVRSQCILVGGVTNSGSSAGSLGDTWGWDGTSWAGSLASLTSVREECSIVADMARSQVVVFGGYSRVLGGVIAASERWNGVAWTPIVGTQPSPRFLMAMAYDSARSRVVAFGGVQQVGSSYTPFNDTWEYDGVQWAQVTTTVAPSARASSMAYDAATGRCVLFGGSSYSQGSVLGDTWTWNGQVWAPATPAQGPAPRFKHAMCTHRGKVLLHAGYGSAPTTPLLQDLWQWTAGGWELLDSGTPSLRVNFGAAYDARHDQVVMFGGMSSNDRANATYNNETWVWTGTAWLRRQPTNSPTPRGWCRLAYDSSRSRVVLFGGADANINNSLQDTWEWDGFNWTQVTPVVRPPGSFGHDLTFDTARNVAVAFGSFGTWDYGPIQPAATASFPAVWPTPATCTGSLGPIRIQTLPWSGPWLGDRFEVDFVNRPANSLGLFLWGFSNTTWNGLPLPIPLSLLNVPSPCNLLVDPFVTELVLAPRYQSFQLPSDPILLAVPMFVQAGFFDNTPQGTQIVTTNGLELTFGRK